VVEGVSTNFNMFIRIRDVFLVEQDVYAFGFWSTIRSEQDFTDENEKENQFHFRFCRSIRNGLMR
jgi:hypothetical protein